MKVLVIENYPGAPAGLFGDWLARTRGATLRTVTPDTLPDPNTTEDLIVTLGSPTGAWEDIDWVHRQRRFLQDAIASGRAVLGICFGAQLLATAIGGRAAPMGRCIVGWHANAETADPVWRGPWVRWHADSLDVPDTATVLARDQGTVQVFHHGRTLGVQFHPEASAAMADEWATKTPDMLARAATTPDTIARDGAASLASGAAARDALFSEMLRRVGA